MLKGKKLLAVVPARGGSKGVKLKNIYPLLGKPLVAYVGDVVKQAGYFDQAVVSTDHPQIAEVARTAGLAAPFYRPEALSGDQIGDYPVLLHALMEMERLDHRPYDVIVMLQPTCPLRKVIHVTAVVTKLIDERWEAVWTVSQTDLHYHPLKQLTIAPDGTMDYYDERGSMIVARQQLQPIYHRNGAAYAFSRHCLLEEKTIKPKRAAAIVIDEPLISIDTLDDFDRVEEFLRKVGSGDR
jgi:CMP-N-acetylneuraminic acid synthetase